MRHGVLAAALVTLTACGGSAEEILEPVREADAIPLQIAHQGVCNARTLAEAGDLWGAANEFATKTHAFLHEFADRLSATDRAAAARLLEAKEAVEAQLNSPDSADPALTMGALSGLQAALADAAEVEGFPRPACEGERR